MFVKTSLDWNLVVKMNKKGGNWDPLIRWSPTTLPIGIAHVRTLKGERNTFTFLSYLRCHILGGEGRVLGA